MSRGAFNLVAGRGLPGEQGPSSDSYRMPLVLLAFDSVDAIDLPRADVDGVALSNYVGQDGVIKLYGNPDGVNEGDGQEYRINAWDAIEDFEFSFEKDAAWIAKFTVFDPTFTILLPRLEIAKREASSIHAYFRFGWIVDGTSPDGNLCRPKSGIITSFVPEFLQDGVRITFEVHAPETLVKMVEKANAAWPSGTPAHVIVKQALEMSNPTVSDLNRRVPLPVVRTPVPCEPIINSGNPIEMKDVSPLTFIRSTILPLAVPSGPDHLGQRMALFESDRENGVFVLAPEGYKEDPQRIPIKRTYNVGRGQSANLIRFTPKDNTVLAQQLGGDGKMMGVDSQSKGINTAEKNAVSNDPAANPPEDTSTSTRFSRMSFHRDLASMAQERLKRWADAQALATEADAEVLGDPHIHVNDYLEFRVYYGGSLSTAGRPDAPQSAQLLTIISGHYVVTSYSHKISGGQYATAIGLTRAFQQTISADAEDPAYSIDTASGGRGATEVPRASNGEIA